MLPSLSRLVVFCESVYWTVTVHGQSVIIKSDEWGREREIAMWSKDESLESVSELYNGLHVIYAWCRHVFIISWGPDSLKNPMKPFLLFPEKSSSTRASIHTLTLISRVILGGAFSPAAPSWTPSEAHYMYTVQYSTKFTVIKIK